MTERRCRVAIIGTGFSGIGTAIRLKQDGIDDLVLFERAADLGGTWRDNTYPGCACDVPSHLYSFSFAPNPRWGHTYSRQGEIWQYLRDCAERFGILPHIRFGHEVLGATWQEDAQHWRIETSAGIWNAEMLVSGAGILSEPRWPEIPGIDSFAGTAFHSAQWDHAQDLGGRTVAVIGTGASAIQFVPEIQKRVARLVLFMRTPPWIVPRNDRPLRAWEHRLYGLFPPAQLALRAISYWYREVLLRGFLKPRDGGFGERLARRHLESQVADAALRARLTPSYRMGCKRILISNDFYPALQQPNVELVTEPIAAIRPEGVLTANGVLHRVDTLIFGTGFNVTEHPIANRLVGRSGRSLAETWEGSPRAHLGTTVAGFPNLFILLGPNTAIGHTSALFMIESQIGLIRAALKTVHALGAKSFEPRAEAQASFVASVDQRMQPTVWSTGGCASWYKDRTGRVAALWPDYTWSFRRRLAHFDTREYRLGAAPTSEDQSVIRSTTRWSQIR
jgi:cation diffusion facilitator CzcD-associated flavoprotein CzcO